ncbi:agglutinin-1-like [Durio zibethinus]|uniref:Agglutinin-1-like n=1 Tax=Durio zibethinus TaxID=66656 RepID=A0A6P5YJH6_DURZI|nr:agglutinin-1-like [Durio zibethinus]
MVHWYILIVAPYIARALIVRIQIMVSKAVRFRNIQQEVLAVAEPNKDGIYRKIYPYSLMIEYQNRCQSWFLSNLRQVLFIIAIMPLTCINTVANLLLLRMPASISSFGYASSLLMAMRSTSLEDQDDNTIRSGGKCLTTYGHSSRNYVMIYDCDTAVSDATKCKIWTDGSIRNPKSGLVLTGSKDSSGTIILVVNNNFYGSRQAWYASNNTKPPVATIVGYNGLCLLASGSRV